MKVSPRLVIKKMHGRSSSLKGSHSRVRDQQLSVQNSRNSFQALPEPRDWTMDTFHIQVKESNWAISIGYCTFKVSG